MMSRQSCRISYHIAFTLDRFWYVINL